MMELVTLWTSFWISKSLDYIELRICLWMSNILILVSYISLEELCLLYRISRIIVIVIIYSSLYINNQFLWIPLMTKICESLWCIMQQDKNIILSMSNSLCNNLYLYFLLSISKSCWVQIYWILQGLICSSVSKKRYKRLFSPFVKKKENLFENKLIPYSFFYQIMLSCLQVNLLVLQQVWVVMSIFKNFVSLVKFYGC